jgi:hypothetical protein
MHLEEHTQKREQLRGSKKARREGRTQNKKKETKLGVKGT